MLRAKAYLFRGVESQGKCAPSLLPEDSKTPAQDQFYFPGGVWDYLKNTLIDRETVTAENFTGQGDLPDNMGRVEWALAWPFARRS